MYDIYNWPTSNGRKVNIMVEELEVDYKIHPIAIGKDDQFTPEFTALNPNQKIPAVIDQDGPGGKPYTMFESGAILMYMAEKHGKFMPTEMAARYETIQWLMFQMGGVGPNFGQAHHFRRAAPEKVPYGIERYTKETRRLWGVMNDRLEGNDWFANNDYSIVDIAIFPWTMRYEWQGIALDEFPNMKRWYEAMEARPGVQRGLAAQVPG
ncbi:MAG: glutathione S-transferase family protein [Rhodospirillaceae bacterium]|jgi:GSH-dependent disulfide-bond oxidoreductase|nr:glutathione S-transferase family protein [Rhodospirillaceae bacterium]MBT5459435.1 glutathione S-transferase family protein [Rhodospirillaceae bacterium]